MSWNLAAEQLESPDEPLDQMDEFVFENPLQGFQAVPALDPGHRNRRSTSPNAWKRSVVETAISYVDGGWCGLPIRTRRVVLPPHWSFVSKAEKPGGLRRPRRGTVFEEQPVVVRNNRARSRVWITVKLPEPRCCDSSSTAGRSLAS